MATHEQRLVAKHFARPLANQPLGGANVGDQRSGRNGRPESRQHVEDGPHRGSQDHQVCVANRLGRVLGALVDRSGGGGAFQDVRPVAAHPRPRKAALPERQPPGAAYEAYAHDSDAMKESCHGIRKLRRWRRFTFGKHEALILKRLGSEVEQQTNLKTRDLQIVEDLSLFKTSQLG